MTHQSFQFRSKGRDLSAAVRSSRRAKHVRLRIVPGLGLEIVIPEACQPCQVRKVLRDHQGWIEEHIEDIEKAALGADIAGVLPERIGLTAVGEDVRVRYAGRASGKPWAEEVRPGLVRVQADPEAEAEACLVLLQEWLKSRARSVLVPWVQDLAGKHGFSVNRVQVRRQKTRLGSMSSSGTMSLNCLLMFLQPSLVQGIILHELCHIRHPDHGPGFLALLSRLCPDWADLRVQTRNEVRTAIPMWAELEL
jgi:hypothetical protein